MAAVLEGFISSRRRPGRSQSESGKQLHARWGDAAITAPNDGGWSQQYLEDDLNTVVLQAHGSPDSQKTLVNDSPELAHEQEKFERVAVGGLRQPTPPVIQKERSAITITIPLPWSRKSHRRSTSSTTSSQPVPVPVPAAIPVTQQAEKVINVESRPVLAPITANIDQVIVAESRPNPDTIQANSAVIHTQSPVYDDISTFFTRTAFPEKHYGAPRLPAIQTGVAPNRSQPASAISTVSAISILSPVAEKYNGLSESDNGTPMNNTPTAAQRTTSALPLEEDELMEFGILAKRLETYRRTTTPPTEPPVDDSALEFSRSTSRNAVGASHSRPSSRGPKIGDVSHMMRPLSREPSARHRSSSRGTVEGTRRSASRELPSHRAGSLEPFRRRALSREPVRPGAESPDRYHDEEWSLSCGGAFHRRDNDGSRDPPPMTIYRRGLSRDSSDRRAESPPRGVRRAYSREPYTRPRRTDSPPPGSRRGLSRDSFDRRATSPPPPTSRRALSREPPPSHRDKSSARRQDRSREPPTRRDISPVRLGRRAASRDTAPSSSSTHQHRRISGTFEGGRRAASMDPAPVRRRASPRHDIVVDLPLRRETPTNTSSGESRRASPPMTFELVSKKTTYSSTGAAAIPTTIKAHDSDSDDLDPDLSPSSPSSEGEEESTDIETETEEMYFESRKGWNGPAVFAAAGAHSRGFYTDVTQDYRAIARDVVVEAELVASGPGGVDVGLNSIVSLIKKDKEKDKENEKEKEREREREDESTGGGGGGGVAVGAASGLRKLLYGGPDLVPNHEDLWG